MRDYYDVIVVGGGPAGSMALKAMSVFGNYWSRWINGIKSHVRFSVPIGPYWSLSKGPRGDRDRSEPWNMPHCATRARWRICGYVFKVAKEPVFL